jgi:hypothetical protein
MSQIAVNRTSKLVLALFANWRLRGRRVEHCRLAMCSYRSSIKCTSTWHPQSFTTTSSVPYVILQLAFPSSDPKKNPITTTAGLAFFSFKILSSSYSQRKTKSIDSKSLTPLATSIPVRNRLLLSSRNRGTSLASSLRIDESFRRGI